MQKYPFLETFNLKNHIIQNEKGRLAQANHILNELEKKEVLKRIEQKREGRANLKNQFKIKQTLKKYNVIDLNTLNQDEYNDFIAKVWSRKQDYKNAPNIVKIAELNETLANKLKINHTEVFLTKKDLSHFRMARKQAYNQALSEEEIKEIPNIIKNSNDAYIDLNNGNFFMIFNDKENLEKVNFIAFNLKL